MSNKLGHSMDNGNKLKWIIGTHGNWEKIQILGSYQLNNTANSTYSLRKWAKWAELAVLFSWQLQNGPRNFYFILFFSIAMGADYSFRLISIVHWVPQFIGQKNIHFFAFFIKKASDFCQILHYSYSML